MEGRTIPEEWADIRRIAIRKVCVAVFPVAAANAALALREKHPEAAAALAEAAVRKTPKDDAALSVFLLIAGKDQARCDRVFAADLDRRPVNIEWHRHHQHYGDAVRGEEAVAREYEGILAKEPDNAALLYLRGRTDPDPKQRLGFYRRAVAADPALPWPHFALGGIAAHELRWNDALQEMQSAQRLGMEPVQLADWLHRARLATGAFDDAAAAARAELTSNPRRAHPLGLLCDALTAGGKQAEIPAALARWKQKPSGTDQDDAASVALGLAFAAYVAGDWPACRCLHRQPDRSDL